jgi:hypothetical protein
LPDPAEAGGRHGSKDGRYGSHRGQVLLSLIPVQGGQVFLRLLKGICGKQKFSFRVEDFDMTSVVNHSASVHHFCFPLLSFCFSSAASSPERRFFIFLKLL